MYVICRYFKITLFLKYYLVLCMWYFKGLGISYSKLKIKYYAGCWNFKKVFSLHRICNKLNSYNTGSKFSCCLEFLISRPRAVDARGSASARARAYISSNLNSDHLSTKS